MSSFASPSGAPASSPRLLAGGPPASAIQEWLAAPSEIRERLSALFADPSTTATVRGPDGLLLRATGQAFEPDAARPCLFRFPVAPRLPTVLTLASPFAAYCFQIDDAERRGGAWATAQPEGVWVWRRRAERRQRAPEEMEVRLKDEEGAPLSAALPVRELSFRSLCVALNAGPAPWLAVGARVRMVLTAPSGEPLSLQGRVARIDDDGEARGVLVLEPGAALDPRWQAWVCRALHPRTRWGKTWAASSWALYEQSGYFHLSSQAPHQFTRLKAAFTQACRKLDHAPELGGQISWPSARGIEASLSLLRLYAATTLVYQVARRKDDEAPSNGREVLRAVNLHAFEQLRRSPEPGWLLIFVQDAGARWSRLAYRTFGERLGPTRGCVVPFRAISHRAAPATRRERDGLDLQDPTPEQRELFLAQLERTRPAAYLEALDLRPGRLALGDLEEAWRRRGLTRRRAVRMLLHRGRPVAASVLELADEGLHLFGLLDCARLYPLRPGAEVFFPRLLEDAQGWFSSQGRARFVHLAEDAGIGASPTAPGAEDLGMARLIAFPKEELPAFLDHLHRITAPRPEKGDA